MAKRVPAHAAGAEVLRRQHAPCSHDANEGIESGFARILRCAEKRVRSGQNGFDQTLLTRHLSNDAASAPELETSSVNPLRLLRMSCSFSKFVRGGGKCRLPNTLNVSARGPPLWTVDDYTEAPLSVGRCLGSSVRR